MTKKQLLKFLGFALLLCLSVACSKDEPVTYQGKNEIFVALKDNDKATTVTLDDTPVEVAVYLTSRLEQPLTLSLNLEGDQAKLVSLSSNSVTIPAGQNMAVVTLSRVADANILTSTEIRLSCTLPSTPTNLSLRSSLLIKLQPEADLALTDEQLKLVEGYKTKFGIDLTQILGKVVCNGRMTYAGVEDYTPYFAGLKNREIKDQTMIVRLSEKSTADQPVLYFSSNALGLAPLLGEIFNQRTILNDAYFYNGSDDMGPDTKYLVEAVNWTPATADKESFDVVLDNIRINTSDKSSLTILGQLSDILDLTDARFSQLDNDKKIVPLSYKSSVLERIYALIKGNEELTTKFTQAGIEPHQLLNNTNIETNEYSDNAESNYISPKATIDLSNGTMSFVFPFDFDGGNGESYMKFEINCKKK